MIYPDFFGLSDRVKRLTPPEGYEDVHRDGYSWAKQGTAYQDTTKLGVHDWNQLIANFRALLTLADVIDQAGQSDPRSPYLLRDVISAYCTAQIEAILSGEDVGSYGLLEKAGGTMTGTLTLAGDPVSSLDAATKQYVDGILVTSDAMVFKGVIACAANPNYPAADAGHTYKVSSAGKIGGASGINVEVGDILVCTTDGTAAGSQASVGANWAIVQTNIDGAVVGPASATDNNLVAFNGTTGKLVRDSGKAAPAGVIVGTSDAQALTNKDMTGAGNTWPTFNQNTTGSAAKLTTPRTIAGVSFDGSANISFDDAIEFVIDGGGAAIVTGMKGKIEVPFACTINSVTLLADQSGSIIVDIWKCTYAQYDAGATHPVAGDKITASAPPQISGATKAQDATLTGWTKTLAKGDILAFNVNSAATVQRVTISLKVTR